LGWPGAPKNSIQIAGTAAENIDALRFIGFL
jgi:hypothetical protein